MFGWDGGFNVTSTKIQCEQQTWCHSVHGCYSRQVVSLSMEPFCPQWEAAHSLSFRLPQRKSSLSFPVATSETKWNEWRLDQLLQLFLHVYPPPPFTMTELWRMCHFNNEKVRTRLERSDFVLFAGVNCRNCWTLTATPCVSGSDES